MNSNTCTITTRHNRTVVVSSPNPYKMKTELRKIRLAKDEAIRLVVS